MCVCVCGIYIYMCMCVCVCSWAADLHLSMLDQIIKTHFVYIILFISFQVSRKVFWF